MSKRYVYVKKRYILFFSIIDFFGFLLCRLVSCFKKPAIDTDVKKIVVVELAHIGDVLAITPALHLLKKNFPQSFLAVIVSPWARDVLSGNPDIDEILVYRASWFDRETKKSFSFHETKTFLKLIRAENFDIGIDLRGDARTILLMWLGRIKKRIGYAYAGAGFLLTDIVPFDVVSRQKKHQIAHHMAFVEALGKKSAAVAGDRQMKIFFDEQDRKYAQALLQANAITTNDVLVMVHPGSGIPAKCWPLERFAQLIEYIVNTQAVKVIVVGSPEEQALVAQLRSFTRAHFIDAIGQTTIKQLAALASYSRLFIGGDSGLMHIASALNVPIIAIWGGHNEPEYWRPMSEGVTVLHKAISCGPCGLAVCRHLSCLKNISVDEVARAVSRYITGIR